MKNNIVISTIVGGFCLSNINAGACCKPVPNGLKDLEILFDNLNGFTYKEIKSFFKKENGKKNIKGSDIISKKIASSGGGLDIVIYVYLENKDKDESATYKMDISEIANGVNYTPVKVKFKSTNGKDSIANDGEYEVDNVDFDPAVDKASA